MTIAPAVEAAVARASDDCAEYAVVSRSSASAQSALRGGEAPDVWIPGSAAYPLLASAAGVELEVGDTIASSPVLLTSTPAVMGALGDLGITPDTTWPELMSTYRELSTQGADAPVALAVPDPIATEVLDRLGDLEPDRMTPIEALMALADLKRTAEG